jgi:hypothetical protein
MEYVPLGRIDPLVSRIALGCMGLVDPEQRSAPDHVGHRPLTLEGEPLFGIAQLWGVAMTTGKRGPGPPGTRATKAQMFPIPLACPFRARQKSDQGGLTSIYRARYLRWTGWAAWQIARTGEDSIERADDTWVSCPSYRSIPDCANSLRQPLTSLWWSPLLPGSPPRSCSRSRHRVHRPGRWRSIYRCSGRHFHCSGAGVPP